MFIFVILAMSFPDLELKVVSLYMLPFNAFIARIHIIKSNCVDYLNFLKTFGL